MKAINRLTGNIFRRSINNVKFGNLHRFHFSIYFFLVLLCFNLNTNSQTIKSENMDTIKVGSSVPSFTLKDQNGKEFDINSVKGKHNLVIYFYPKDETPGCTKEACTFRDQFDVFTKENAVIIGISGQSVASHLQFANKYHLNFTLLSDEGNKVRKLFGVPSTLGMPGRVTYVVNKEGKVMLVFNSQFNAAKHIDEALHILKEMK
ncbi:MAG: peroxiredoxin [Paludibacter sp.]|nr:peroxiredoxin [Paludibacter sp.]